MKEKLLIIDATTKCNQQCVFCFERDIHFTRPDLSLNKVKNIISKSKKDGFNYVVFMGGEITLVEWLPEAITFIKRNKMGAGIATNGTIFSNREYAKKLINAGLDHIELSFHSHIAADEYKITGLKNGLALRKKALKNIDILRGKDRHPFLYINIVVNVFNFKYLRKTVKVLQKFRFEHIDIKALRITDNVKDVSIVPRFSAMNKYLEMLMFFLTKEKVPFKFENIPLCCISTQYHLHSMELMYAVKNPAIAGYGFYYNNTGTKNVDSAIFNGKNEIQGKCITCFMKKFCSRPQKEYLEIFGDKEFIPITDAYKKIISK